MQSRWLVLAAVFASICAMGIGECASKAQCQSCGSQCLNSSGCAVHCACMKYADNIVGECVHVPSRVSAQ